MFLDLRSIKFSIDQLIITLITSQLKLTYVTIQKKDSLDICTILFCNVYMLFTKCMYLSEI